MSTSLYCGFDTEDDGAGTATLACFVHARGAWHASSREKWLEKLARMGEDVKAEGGTLTLWAVNLEYDLVNLFGKDRIAEVSLRFGRSHLVGARWRGIEFRDVLRHMPASVAELGELLGIPKLEGDLFDGSREVTPELLLRRCRRDATITYRAAEHLRAVYGEFGESPRMTLPSTAFRIWRDRFWKRDVVRPLAEVWDAAREAYHGGRTEPFAVGEFENVIAIDAASMFPWAMVAKPFPLPWGAARRIRAGGDVEPFGIYRVRVTSSLARPTLPYRSESGTVYPNGSWVGWYVGEELHYFAHQGGRFRVLGGFEFLEECRPFEGYVAEMFARKNSSRGPMRQAFKLLLNSLYGKFGQQGERVVAMPLEKFARLPKRPLVARHWCGLAIYRTEAAPPPWSNMVWPAFVTARARIRLHEAISSIESKGGRVLYCDTDSVMYQGERAYPKTVERPGDFEHRGDYRRALIVGKKEYALETVVGWESHAKGVPKAVRGEYLRTGEAEFSLPVRLRQSSVIGVDANVWRTVRKVRRVSFKKRARKPDGSLAPLVVNA